jgi:hypothetical protein
VTTVKPLLYVLLLLLLFPLFFFWGPDYYSARSLAAGWNLGHIGFFAVLSTVLLQSRWLAPRGFYWQLLVTLAVSLVAGVLIELVQGGFERDADSADVYRNCLGALLVNCWSTAARQALRRTTLLTVRVTSGVLLLQQLALPSLALLDEWRASSQFPVLADFESRWELARWRADDSLARSGQYVYEGEYALFIQLGTQRYSGIALQYFPRDWRTYSSLRCELYQPAVEPLFITVRIHDRLHRDGEQLYSDRFNQRYQLQQGWNSIAIDLRAVEQSPATRLMDMSAIEGLGVFVSKENTPKQLYLDYVRLQ